MGTIAIIPARGGSKRVPRKNIIEICGRPALAYPIAACVESGLFDNVIVSTDDSEIAEIARGTLATDVYSRPEELSNSKAKVRDVVSYVISQYETLHGHIPETLAIVYPTAVLIQPHHLQGALLKLQETEDVDFTLAVTKMHPHAYKALKVFDGYLRPVFPDKIDLKGQEQPEFYVPCGAFHFAKVKAFMENEEFWYQKRNFYVLDQHEAVDLDEPADLYLIRALLEASLRKKRD